MVPVVYDDDHDDDDREDESFKRDDTERVFGHSCRVSIVSTE
jgi:hypothetical protein